MSARDEGDSGEALRDPLASLAPGQAGFLAILTHCQAGLCLARSPRLVWALHPAQPRSTSPRAGSSALFPVCLSASSLGSSVSGPFQVMEHRAWSLWELGRCEGMGRFTGPLTQSVTRQPREQRERGPTAPYRASLTFPTNAPK